MLRNPTTITPVKQFLVTFVTAECDERQQRMDINIPTLAPMETEAANISSCREREGKVGKGISGTHSALMREVAFHLRSKAFEARALGKIRLAIMLSEAAELYSEIANAAEAAEAAKASKRTTPEE